MFNYQDVHHLWIRASLRVKRPFSTRQWSRFPNWVSMGFRCARSLKKASVSKANIYHHFNSKEALYLAIMQARTLIGFP